MLTLWLCDGCLQEFSLPRKLYICRGAKCLESFCQGCEHFLNNRKVRPEVIFSSQPATDEDNKRTASVWDGLRRKARRCKCIVVACWRGKKRNEKSAPRWSLVWQVRCQWQRCTSQLYRHKQLLKFFKEPEWFVGFVGWKLQSKCQGLE